MGFKWSKRRYGWFIWEKKEKKNNNNNLLLLLLNSLRKRGNPIHLLLFWKKNPCLPSPLPPSLLQPQVVTTPSSQAETIAVVAVVFHRSHHVQPIILAARISPVVRLRRPSIAVSISVASPGRPLAVTVCRSPSSINALHLFEEPSSSAVWVARTPQLQPLTRASCKFPPVLSTLDKLK